jgi:hypothetical protein
MIQQDTESEFRIQPGSSIQMSMKLVSYFQQDNKCRMSIEKETTNLQRSSFERGTQSVMPIQWDSSFHQGM